MRYDEIASLEAIAVDQKYLVTNFADVVPDCCNDAGADAKNELKNRYELYNWLQNTELARRVRNLIGGDNGICILHKGTDGYELEVPATFYSLDPADTSEECCWAPIDFAKCKGSVPVKRLCLKDCASIDDELLSRVVSIGRDYGEIASANESKWEVQKRIARLSMAFLTNNNVIDGTTSTTTSILKPFHGLLEVMSNPAVVAIQYLGSIVATFDSMFCRMSVLGGLNRWVFAIHPLLFASIRSELRRDQFGEYPDGWAVNGNQITFNGIGFIQDERVPLNLTTNTGEIWVLDGGAVGSWMATDLMPTDAFIKESGHQEQTLANGCGSSCTYYYNYGAVFNNNSSRVMRVTGVPVSSACINGITGLDGLINPTTLIPA